MVKIIGIDLGTSNSAAAVMEGGKPTIIPSAEGQTLSGKMFPSVVAFTKEGERLVGEPARRQAQMNPERTITAIKRKMGTTYKVKMDKKSYSPQEISAMVLQKIKADAEAFLGEKVTEAVITVPAYFNDSQRQATKDAGKIAGLEVKRLVNEPTAASLAYGLDKEEKELTIAVLDLGGGTFDVTIMEMGEGVFEVKSTSGDTQLGGTDMDNKIVDFIADEFKREQGMDIRKDNMAMQRLKEAAEKAKIELSGVVNTNVNLPFITADSSGPKHLSVNLSRAKLEDLIADVLDKLVSPIQQALDDAKITGKEVAKVILVGGPTRMPCVQKKFKEFFGKDAERGVDPMECVAIGAAIQAGVLSGEVKDLLLLDVTPLSLGIETLGNVFTRLIERNTTIPTRKSQIFSTATDNQPSVEIHVLQGEREMVMYNKTLGKFHLIGIPPAPRGIPQIEVTFNIDANGIVHVSAKDLGTGNEQDITITGSSTLKDSEIDGMVKEAEKHAEDDKIKKEEVDIKNQADSLIYATERAIKDMKDKLDESKKADTEKAIEELKETLKGTNIGEIKEKSENLSKVSQELFAAVYQQAAQQAAEQQQAQQQQSNGTKEKDDVVDADYEVVDDDK